MQQETTLYPHEKNLFRILLSLSIIFWSLVTVATLGVIWLLLLVGGIPVSLALRSIFISNLKGNGIKVSQQQFPEIYQHFLACCQKLNFKSIPELYLLNSEGLLNALATRFLRRHYVVLYSSVVDALESHSSALRFYLGHELGHIQRKHLLWNWFIEPMTVLPIIGKAYLRAREYTCDRYGLMCCENANDSLKAIAVLAAGSQGWKKLNLEEYKKQSQLTGGFWSSIYELNASYPWLSKRFAWIEALSRKSTPLFPKRNWLSFLISSLIPNTSGLIFLSVIIWISYSCYLFPFNPFDENHYLPTEVKEAVQYGMEIVTDINQFAYKNNGYLPNLLSKVGYSEDMEKDFLNSLEYRTDSNQSKNLILTLRSTNEAINNKTIVFIPYVHGDKIVWHCRHGSLANQYRPMKCKKRVMNDNSK